MEEVKNLVSKLAKVMQEVKYIQKTGFNTFHKYKYATEADVNEKVREELAKLNIAMFPSIISHSMREHTNRSGSVEYITCVNMEFTFVDGDTGESFTINMSGEGQDAGDKGIYKAIAGAQKYALMKAFMIPTGDDPEADEGVDERNHGKPKDTKTKPAQQTPPSQKQPPKQDKPSPETEKINPKGLAALHARAKELNLTHEELGELGKGKYGVESLKDLTTAQGREFYKMLDKQKPAQTTTE